MFYVYEWFVKKTGEVIYVGKGSGHRYQVRKHNQFFNDFINREDCESRIIKEFESEQDAFAYEYERVKELKAIGQCVCNIYKGGMGGVTTWWTDKMRDQYSKRNVMKSKKQRKRMSKNNPMKNPEISSRVAAKKSRAVVIDGKEYPSVKSAAQEIGVIPETIRKWCVRGENFSNQKCLYKDGNVNYYKPRKNSQGNQQPSRGNTDNSTTEGSTTNR